MRIRSSLDLGDEPAEIRAVGTSDLQDLLYGPIGIAAVRAAADQLARGRSRDTTSVLDTNR